MQKAVEMLEDKITTMQTRLNVLIQSNLGDKKRLLLVDDSLVVQKSTKRILEHNGFQVQTSENGAQALDSMEDSEFDIVLMDIEMPVMNGIEAMRNIRRKERQAEEAAKLLKVSEEEGMECDKDGAEYASSSSSNSGSSSNTTAISEEQIYTSRETGALEMVEVGAFAKKQKKTFIIVVSAYSDEMSINESLTAGADAFLSKPFCFQQFDETMVKLKTSFREDLLSSQMKNICM
jgi:CheY-like chemotaxis protein